jgi:hypothetical protein
VLLNRLGYDTSSPDVKLDGATQGWDFLREGLFEGRVLPYPMVSWGIFNPNGPTWCSLLFVRPSDADTSILYFQMSNPFSSFAAALGFARLSVSETAMFQELRNLFARNGNGLFFKCPPTFVLTSCSAGLMQPPDVVADWMYASLNTLGVTGLDRRVADYRRFWLKPWDRLTYQRDRIYDELKKQSTGSSGPEQNPFTAEDFKNWYAIVSDPQHVKRECEAVVQGWIGATKCYAPQLPSTDVEEGLGLHMTLTRLTPDD